MPLQNAVWMLSCCYRRWLDLNPDDKTSLNILNEELSHLVHRGVYSHLLTAHPRLTAELILLPVLYADVESVDIAKFLLANVIQNCCHMFKEADALFKAYCLLVSSFAVAQLVTEPRDDCRLTAAQVLGCLGRQGAGCFFAPHFTNCERYLVDCYPRVLYHVLMADSMQAAMLSDMRAVVGGRLHRLLEHAARALGKEVHKEVDSPEGGAIVSQLREVLMPLVWDLGAEEIGVSAAASRALSVLCFLCEHKAWRVGGLDAGDEQQFRDQVRDCTASLLSVQFMHLMAKLLQSDQHEQLLSQQVRCLRCLRQVSGLLRHTDLAKFLPKVRPPQH